MLVLISIRRGEEGGKRERIVGEGEVKDRDGERDGGG
jgi:hypothetical protein